MTRLLFVLTALAGCGRVLGIHEFGSKDGAVDTAVDAHVWIVEPLLTVAADCAGFVALDATDVFFNSPIQEAVKSVPKTGGAQTKWFDMHNGSNPGYWTAGTISVSAQWITASNYYDANGYYNRTTTMSGGINACVGTNFGVQVDADGMAYAAHTSPCGSGTGAINQFTTPSTSAPNWQIDYGTIGAAQGVWIAFTPTDILYIGRAGASAGEGLYKATKSNGTPTLLAGGSYPSTTQIALDGTTAYVARNDAIAAVDINTMAVTELTPPQTWMSVLASYQRVSIAFDDDWVYWTADDGVDGGGMKAAKIMRVRKTGGDPEVVVGKQPYGYGMAVDATHVYWTTTAGVFKAAK